MLACLDLEGVLVPEIWIAFAKQTGIEKLRLTTRDIPDYDALMRGRLKILDEHKLKLEDIQKVIREIKPLEGAKDFLAWLKSEFQVIILSDTFYQFAGPLMAQLDYPALFCNELVAAGDGRITDYRLRQADGKTKAVAALQSMNFQVIAAGDSYNDTGMLKQADAGIFFRPPESITKEFPQFPVTHQYDEMKQAFLQTRAKLAR
ncbi:MAG: bifunctional phosphoserine phosphatase/homoserine phosphotransferase ThrH [Nitrospinae bacterium]|nr:bifunctional phosphoserine phosphatase/homoserine phosphotransferase ThrH [Nitrospinota bacterium]MCH7500340.1 bifunctional phosphoserine phosphatase/homoserine phosphotransferase ThrH [Nitrospinota bacterium]MCH7649614.1 bifunctional phosphoserine phosphatase/homoserine phosphotransferase ThrH [Nitrospinota bacterium]MCH8931966.1 bifunctional phosphoserine phosphatase/homoserine phosphotransferase ThrH [Nitrospinota bacterium]